MSCQRGNANRSRPQKYQNQKSFKNNLYDKSQKIKQINSTEVTNVCERCKKVIEWKIKYKKYKVLKAPVKCIKCEQKTVKHSYHNICLLCAKQQRVCSKCGQKTEVVEGTCSKEEQIKLDAEFKAILKTLPERKRRTLLRYMNQQSIKSKENNNKPSTSGLNTDTDETDRNEDETCPERDLLMKIKSLALIEDDNLDSDIDEEEIDNFGNDVNLRGRMFSK
ncbi:Uncharacterized protein C9orf85 like protein [Trachymyrmex septentrionalis]|uniref:Uncharacterized protein C9orf85 like protein n=1 Tax=Trachymyrmex septentrionalis TaxID=34720 RepID=A0A195FKD2_9HYME|nr:PREDICTED: uncharacterized protein LOC108746832 [Trachymyrmex septentrionalis]KYN41125.1 Uncharacterized protein C9orf85 like protein [Trachymyrmex septentrionalis]